MPLLNRIALCAGLLATSLTFAGSAFARSAEHRSPRARLAEASHAGWPSITGMLLQNSTNESRPLDGRPGHDPFDGTDPSYSCDGEDSGGSYHLCGFPRTGDGPRFTTLARLEQECGREAAPTEAAPAETPPSEVPGRKHPPSESESPGLTALATGASAAILPPGLPASCAAKYEQADLVPANIGHNEMLGGHGNDTIHAGPAGDVIWGDSQAQGQPESQVDRLYGGAGNDWLYASHGTNYIWTGGGNDHILLVYGHGVVYCNGPGHKTLVMRKLAANRHYRLVGCTDKTIVPYAA